MKQGSEHHRAPAGGRAQLARQVHPRFVHRRHSPSNHNHDWLQSGAQPGILLSRGMQQCMDTTLAVTTLLLTGGGLGAAQHETTHRMSPRPENSTRDSKELPETQNLPEGDTADLDLDLDLQELMFPRRCAGEILLDSYEATRHSLSHRNKQQTSVTSCPITTGISTGLSCPHSSQVRVREKEGTL